MDSIERYHIAERLSVSLEDLEIESGRCESEEDRSLLKKIEDNLSSVLREVQESILKDSSPRLKELQRLRMQVKVALESPSLAVSSLTTLIELNNTIEKLAN